MVRKALYIALLCATTAFCEQVGVTEYVGLNNNESALIIGSQYAQDLQNVDVTPGGKSVKKRPGFGVYKDIDVGGVHGGHHFFDSTGNDVQVWGSSKSLTGIVSDGTPTVLVSSATEGATWDCADTQGFAYCVNSIRDLYVRTTGAAIAWQTSPLGTMIEATPDRMVVAGVVGAPSSLYISAANSFLAAGYTVGSLSSDAFIEPITAPGSHITHIRWGCGKLLWWKDQSFGYTQFEDQYTLENKIVSDTIGTFDNTSAIDPGGNVWFRGQDGHIWRYDCSGLTKESIEITPNIQSSGRRTSNSFSVTNASDFSAGNMVSTITYSSTDGGITISTVNVDTSDNSFEAGSIWTATSWSRSTGGFPRTYDNCVLAAPFNGVAIMQYSQASSTYVITASVIDANTSVVLASTSFSYANNSCTWSTRAVTGLSAYVKRYAKVQFSSSHNPAHLLTSPAFAASGSSITFRTASDTNFGTFTMNVDYVQGGVTTMTNGVYYSAVKNAPNISAWSTFNPTSQISSGSIVYNIRRATQTFSVLSTTPSAWTPLTANSLVTASTGTYFQIISSFTVHTATNAITLNNFTVNWYDGSASDQTYMHYFDNAIWASVAFGVGVSSNTHIFRRDLINDGWTVYNFGTGGFATQNNRLYFGDVSTGGNVFLYGSGTSDNGSAINAYWKSKEFAGADPFNENQLTQIDTILSRDASQSLTTTYTVGASNATSYTISLSSSTNSIITHRKTLPAGKNGYTFNVKYSNNSTTGAFELLGYRLGYIQLPWKPSQ